MKPLKYVKQQFKQLLPKKQKKTKNKQQKKTKLKQNTAKMSKVAKS